VVELPDPASFGRMDNTGAARVTPPFPSPLQPTTRLAESDRSVALVIEDDPDTRGRLADILAGAGWSVRQAWNGELGLCLAREHVPEVILLDLALPGMSGIEVLRELKSRRWTDQPTRVVVVSAYAALVRFGDRGLADGVVRKPFARHELLAQLARATGRTAPRRAVPSVL
jgi:DNA-binding response OmpR family regulator